MGEYVEDEDCEDGGLPDAAFTDDELEAGVQHLMRGTSGKSKYADLDEVPSYERRSSGTVEELTPGPTPLYFATFRGASEWSRASSGAPFTRAADGQGFTPKVDARATPVTNRYLPSRWLKPADRSKRLEEFSSALLKYLPHLHAVYTGRPIRIRLSRSALAKDISRLGREAAGYLRPVLVEHLEMSRVELAGVMYWQARRRGDLGVSQRERFIQTQEIAISMLDRAFPENRPQGN